MKILMNVFCLRKRICTVFILLAIYLNLPAIIFGKPMPMISVIIDDVGDSQSLGYRAANLPANVALSILPHTPFAKEIADFGHQRGMDIMLHQPMESFTNVRLLGPGALLQDMQRQQFAAILENNIKAIPHVIGINNHMGSLLTTDREKMNWLMAELKPRELFFIDSRTTTKTIAANIAEDWQIPFMSRKVFLDHYDDPAAIDEQFQRLLLIAKKYGHAIAIGHPRKNTLRYLEKNLPSINKVGFRLVSPSTAMASLFPNQLVKNQPIESARPVHLYDGCYAEYRANNNIRGIQYYSIQCIN